MFSGEATTSVCHTRGKYLERDLIRSSFVSGSDLAIFFFLRFLMSLS